ncbi:response regulator [Lachnospiraceae bacterium ZAX-1]
MNNETISILITDDSILLRKQLKDILQYNGCRNFIEASNGQEAIDKFKASRPNLIFLDIVMPVKDGITATKEIREIDPDAYIVVISSLGTQTQLQEALAAGVKAFIQKPLRPEQIVDVLARSLEGR